MNIRPKEQRKRRYLPKDQVPKNYLLLSKSKVG